MHFEHKIITASMLTVQDKDGNTPGDDNWRVVGVLPTSAFDGVIRVILERER